MKNPARMAGSLLFLSYSCIIWTSDNIAGRVIGMFKGKTAYLCALLAAVVCLLCVGLAEEPEYKEISYTLSGKTYSYTYSDSMLLANGCELSADMAKASVGRSAAPRGGSFGGGHSARSRLSG